MITVLVFYVASMMEAIGLATVKQVMIPLAIIFSVYGFVAASRKSMTIDDISADFPPYAAAAFVASPCVSAAFVRSGEHGAIPFLSDPLLIFCAAVLMIGLACLGKGKLATLAFVFEGASIFGLIYAPLAASVAIVALGVCVIALLWFISFIALYDDPCESESTPRPPYSS